MSATSIIDLEHKLILMYVHVCDVNQHEENVNTAVMVLDTSAPLKHYIYMYMQCRVLYTYVALVSWSLHC